MQQDYTSDELFHFVGRSQPTDHETNYEVVRSILRSSCISHWPHDGSWGSIGYTIAWDRRLEDDDLIVPTVVCFADIPWCSLAIHIAKYGSFGVSFSRSLLVEHAARPVAYVPMWSRDWGSRGGRSLLRDIEATTRGFNKQLLEPLEDSIPTSRRCGNEPSSSEEALAALGAIYFREFLAYLKPFNSELPRSNLSNFYMEREWRMLGNFKFEPDQVLRIVTAPGYVERLELEFPAYRGKVAAIA
ncbi:MAG: hypothetical protein LC667_02885 [Thioalkalivibrio sp.]|nr:hypothetical protein [Thioalkalivibrio sp.]